MITEPAALTEAQSPHADRILVRRGKPDNPVGFAPDEEVVRLKGCPDCNGRGYYLIYPFVTGGSNGAGGMSNMCQCLTCADSKNYCLAYGELPPSVVADMERQNRGQTAPPR